MSEQLQHTTVEPSFLQRRKQEGHKLKRTYTATCIDRRNKDDEPELPKNKALLYKAGYRRVQFDMPTEYRLQYVWPTDVSPLMKASIPNTDSTENQRNSECSKKILVNRDNSRNYKHIINGAPVDGQTHTIHVIEDPLKSTNCMKTDDNFDKENVKNMQDTRKFKTRMKGTKSSRHTSLKLPIETNRSRKTQVEAKQSKPNSIANTDAIPVESELESNAKKTDVKPKEKIILPAGTVKENKTKAKKKNLSSIKQIAGKEDHRRSSTCSYPLVTEYQSSFNCEYSEDDKAFLKRQFEQSSLSIGLKDHVKDIIYFSPTTTHHNHQSKVSVLHASHINNGTPAKYSSSQQPKATVIIPHTYVPSWITEYSSNFVSPLKMSYVSGIWQEAPQPVNLSQPSEPQLKDCSPVFEKKVASDTCQSPAVSSWFDQVLELREKVQEYRRRGNEGANPSCKEIIEEPLQSNGPISLSTPTLSISSISQEDSISNVTVTQTMSSQCTKPSVDEANDSLNTSSIVCTCENTSATLDTKDEQHSKPNFDSSDLQTYPKPQATPDVTTSIVKPSFPQNSTHICSVPLSRKILPVRSQPFKHPVAPTLIYSKPKCTTSNLAKCPVKRTRKKLDSHILTPSGNTSPHSSLCHSSTPEVHVQHPSKVSHGVCKTCKAPDPVNHSLGNNDFQSHTMSGDSCDICHYSVNHSAKDQSTTQPLSTRSALHKLSIPVCPPSCYNCSVCKDDSFSLSSVSISSSCSVASEILERAKQRQQHFWTGGKLNK